MSKLRTLAAVLFALTALARAGNGLAFVDMEKLFEGYYKTARSDAALKQQREVFAEHARTLAAEVDRLKNERDELHQASMNIALAAAVRQDKSMKTEEINGVYTEKQKELKEFVQRTERDLQARYLELREDIVRTITDFVRNHGKRLDYDAILDISGQSKNFIPIVVYYPEGRDLTAEILAKLNLGHEDEVALPVAAAPDTETKDAEK